MTGLGEHIVLVTIIISTGSAQELIITSGGENIAPVPIENQIMAQLSEILSNAMVVGDQRKHLSVILALKTQTELVGSEGPSDLLHPDVVKFLQEHHCSVRTVGEVVAERNPILEQIITDGLERANRAAQSRAHRVHKFLIAPNEFSIGTGELTPTMKLKRHFILKKYKKDIDRLYD